MSVPVEANDAGKAGGGLEPQEGPQDTPTSDAQPPTCETIDLVVQAPLSGPGDNPGPQHREVTDLGHQDSFFPQIHTLQGEEADPAHT